MKVINNGKYQIKIVEPHEAVQYLTESDKEMDRRSKEAVRAAISKAKFCNKLVAKYDNDSEKAYLEYPDGVRVYG